MAAPADNIAASSGRILVHCLAHGAWDFGFAMAALVWLSQAESTSDIIDPASMKLNQEA